MQDGQEAETGVARTGRRLRAVRANVGTIGSFLPFIFLDSGIELIAGRSSRPLGSLVWFSIIAVATFAWSNDIGFRKGAALLLFVPLYGWAVQGRAVYRILSLPERKWTGSFPDRWTLGLKILVVASFLLAGLIYWNTLSRTGISFDRTFEESVAVDLRKGFREGDRALLLAHHKGLGFLVKQGGESSYPTVQWRKKQEHWYGSDWVPVGTDYRESRGFDLVNCYVGTPYSYCLARLPEDAVFFELDAGGRRFSGSASSGVGVVFANPPEGFTAWRAFNQDGVLIAGYSFEPTPRRESGTTQPTVKVARPSGPQTPLPSPSSS